MVLVPPRREHRGAPRGTGMGEAAQLGEHLVGRSVLCVIPKYVYIKKKRKFQLFGCINLPCECKML